MSSQLEKKPFILKKVLITNLFAARNVKMQRKLEWMVVAVVVEVVEVDVVEEEEVIMSVTHFKEVNAPEGVIVAFPMKEVQVEDVVEVVVEEDVVEVDVEVVEEFVMHFKRENALAEVAANSLMNRLYNSP